MSVEELHKVEELLGRLRENIQSPEDKELLLVAIDALNYSTDQSYPFQDYRERIGSNDPPPVVASFATRAYRRQGDLRYLPSIPVLEYYLAQLAREEPPVAVASFDTREEADAWLKAQPERVLNWSGRSSRRPLRHSGSAAPCPTHSCQTCVRHSPETACEEGWRGAYGTDGARLAA